MNIKFVKELKVKLSNSEIEALSTTSKILASIEREIIINELSSEDVNEIIGDAWCEHWGSCTESVSNLIDEVINIANE